MAIKRVTFNTLSYLVAEIKSRYATKEQLSALTQDVNGLESGKADKATTLAGYGITDGMTATEIASAISVAIAGVDHLEREIVNGVADIDLTAQDAERKIYMVKNAASESGNFYDEYMVVNGKLEKVGDWKVDLSDYTTQQQVTAAIANALVGYAKTNEVTAAINSAVSGLIKLTSLSVAESGNGNVVTQLVYDKTTGKFTVKKGLTALQESDFVEITAAEITTLFS